MKKPSCEVLLQYYPKKSEVEDLLSTYVVNCVFNSFLCYSAIMLNIVTIQAIRKTPSLPKTLKTLLLSLAISDVGVGLLVHPFYISLLVNWLQHDNPSCITYNVFLVTKSCVAIASFLGVTAISVDRFLAIHLHLRYQELVTHKLVVAVVTSIWVFSTSISLTMFWVQPDKVSVVISTGGVFCLLLTTVVYSRIYVVVKQHNNQIQALQVQETAQIGEMANFATLVKSAVGIFYIYLMFLACNLPYFACMAAYKIYGPTIALKRLLLFSSTLLYANSSLNPVIYCLKMRHIRHAIVEILRDISCQRDQ
ncbi:adenosine receptor A2b-like [Oculina patagonica]